VIRLLINVDSSSVCGGGLLGRVSDAWLVNVEYDPFIPDGGGGSVYVE
jgi:hypothetical protein